jgi:hypothetical protein
MGIYSKIFQVGKRFVKGAINNQQGKQQQQPQRVQQKPKPNYTPVIIGALGVLVITGIIINNNKNK